MTTGSPTPDAHATPTSARRVSRVLLAGLTACALLLSAACSSKSAKSERTATAKNTPAAKVSDQEAPPQTTPTTAAPTVPPRNLHAGDCVVWQQAPLAPVEEVQTVPCTQEHLLEITGPVDLAAKYTSVPADKDWPAIITSECESVTATALGYALDPNGRFFTDSVEPSPRRWAGGDRTLWCAMGARPTVVKPFAGWRTSFTGVVKGQSQDLLYAVGTCIGITAGSDTARSGTPGAELTDVVPCNGPHGLEITGNIDVSGKIKDFSLNGELANYVGPLCQQMARDYHGKPLENEIAGSFFDIPWTSWQAGRRIAQCTIGYFHVGTIRPVNAPLRG